jgi:hypothetical protein
MKTGRAPYTRKDLTFCILDCGQIHRKNESRKRISKIARSLFDDTERRIHSIREGVSPTVESKSKQKCLK